MKKPIEFVPGKLRPLPAAEPGKPCSQAQRDRDAAAYWDSLTEEQEAWALRKLGFHEFGSDR